MKKHIKSVLSIITVICLMISVLTFNVSAASASATISGAGEYNVGQSVSVTLKYSADFALYGVEASISYNSSVLRLDSVSGADYNVGNSTVKIVDTNFSSTKQSTTSSYTLKFTAIAAGNSNISATVLGAGGDASNSFEASASTSAAVTVVTPKPSSNANLASIKLSSGSLSPAFSANTTSYSATVKYSVDSITITGAVADGGATYTGGGTFGLNIGDNSHTLTVTAADGTKKSYTVNIKRMTEQETLDAEAAAREANPLLVVINDVDYTIVNYLTGISIPTGFTQATATRKESEITVLNDAGGKYQLCWLTNADGVGAFYKRDENDNFTKLAYINANDTMYIIEGIDSTGTLPLGFARTKYEIDGQEVDAIKYDDELLADFYIFNCYVSGQSENTLYRYDTQEGTMQRAADFDAAVKAAAAEPIEDEQQSTGRFAWFNNMTKTGKLVFVIIIFAAVVLIAVAIILIVKIASSRDDDDEYVSEANNDFVLNDFADEEDTVLQAENPVEDISEQENEETKD